MNVEKKPVHVSTGFSASQANNLYGYTAGPCINFYPDGSSSFSRLPLSTRAISIIRVEQTGKDNSTANGGHEHAFCGRAGCDAENQDGQVQADENQCADECDDSFCFQFICEILRERHKFKNVSAFLLRDNADTLLLRISDTF